MNHRRNGFTVLELLVVVAVIGILTAIIIAVTNTSRAKARDAAIVSEMKQFEILLGLEFSESGNYAKLKSPGKTPGANPIYSANNCVTAFPPPPSGSNYYLKARELCRSIVSKVPSRGFFMSATTVNRKFQIQPNKYSLMVTLNRGPYNDNYYCLGSSGTSTGNSLSGLGCWSNP